MEPMVLLSALLEPLKVNNQYWWNLEDFKLFGSLYVFFTFVTVPFIIFIKQFLLLELIKAIINRDALVLPVVKISSLSITIHSVSYSTEMPLERLVKIAVPMKLKDQITLSCLTVIETNIVLNTNLVKHVKHSVGATEWKWTSCSTHVVVTEVAVHSVARGVLNFEYVWHALLWPNSLSKFFFPVLFV